MKRFLIPLISIILFSVGANITLAATLGYHDIYEETYWVNTDSSTPDFWALVYFPSSTARGTYDNNVVFEYDTYKDHVNYFLITLTGHGDNSSSPIDIYLSLADDHSSYFWVDSYDVPTSDHFHLTLDLKNGHLLYNWTDTGSILSNLDLNSFVTYDSFWVGYACHFYHDKTQLDLRLDLGSSHAPEPSTMLLLGSGLIGLAGYGRKKFFKK